MKAIGIEKKWGKRKYNQIRYVIIDETTGEIMDDCDGLGYKTAQNAHKGYAYRHRTPERIQKDKDIKKWLKNNYYVLDDFFSLMYSLENQGQKITSKQVANLFEETNALANCPYTFSEIYRNLIIFDEYEP